MNFFGKKPDPPPTPAELAKKWKRELGKVVRGIERDISNLKRAENKSLLEVKKLAKSGNVKAAKILAREVVNTRKAVERLHMAKSQCNSVAMDLQTTASMIKVSGCMAKSAEVMMKMNKLVNIPEISQTMANMAREMEKAGVVEEIIGETLDSMDGEGVETEANLEVDRIVAEITAGILAPAGAAPETLKRAARPAAEEVAAEEEPAGADDSDMRAMEDRLQAL